MTTPPVHRPTVTESPPNNASTICALSTPTSLPSSAPATPSSYRKPEPPETRYPAWGSRGRGFHIRRRSDMSAATVSRQQSQPHSRPPGDEDAPAWLNERQSLRP
jgi:hypothetical protein